MSGLFGRDAELARLRSLLAATRSGGQAVLVAGDAGIGKSALVQVVRREAFGSGFRELRCHGHERSEAGAFEGLRELLDPVLPLLGSLPDRQRSALSTALALRPPETPNQLLMSLGVLGLLEEAAEREPLLLVVEDLQWLDAATVAVLRFLSRRLGRATVLLVMTVRTGGTAGDVSWMPAGSVLDLGPLGTEDAGRLLDDVAGELSEFARERLLATAAGNPLALRELPAAWRDADDDPARPPGGAGLTRRLEGAFAAAAAQLPARSRRLLLLAAAGHELTLQELAAAGGELDLGPADLDPLERSGLLAVVGGRWHFRHPLVSSAVYWVAPADERAQAHRALAAVLPDAARSAWHRATALVGRDESVAAVLEDAAWVAARRGAPQEAAAAFYRAGTLSPHAADAGRRFAWSAEMSRRFGRYGVALKVIGEALPGATDAFTLTMLAATEIGIHIMAGRPARSTVELLQLVRDLGGPDGNAAGTERTQLLWALALRCSVRPPAPGDAKAVEAELLAIGDQAGAAEPARQVALALLDPLAHRGIRAGLGALLAQARTDPRLLLTLGMAAESLQDLPTALAAWVVSADQMRSAGTALDEAQALTSLAKVRILLGDLRGGLTDVDLALQVAAMIATTGENPLLATAHSVQALGAAWRGDDERALTAAGLGRDPASSPRSWGLATSDWAAGLVALARHRHQDAHTLLTATAAHRTTAAWAVADLTEAAVGCGQQASAWKAVAEIEEILEGLDSAHLRMLVHRSRALLSTDETAETHHLASIECGRSSGARLELARSQLAYGQWLRRRRRAVEARPQLAEARQQFQQAGAAPWADRALRELRAAGADVDVHRPGAAPGSGGPGGVLTAQEQQIAQLAAAGMTNKQIADRIYLSHRTVGAHLYRIFPKLGITSRWQLQEVFAVRGEDPGS